jgi:hypothetical protein
MAANELITTNCLTFNTLYPLDPTGSHKKRAVAKAARKYISTAVAITPVQNTRLII